MDSSEVLSPSLLNFVSVFGLIGSHSQGWLLQSLVPAVNLHQYILDFLLSLVKGQLHSSVFKLPPCSERYVLHFRVNLWLPRTLSFFLQSPGEQPRSLPRRVASTILKRGPSNRIPKCNRLWSVCYLVIKHTSTIF